MKNWKSWIGSYICAGIIFAQAQGAGFTKTTGGEAVSLIVAIGVGFFYHKLKNKIKIKNELLRIIVTFIILEMIAGGIIGLSTGLISSYSERVDKVTTDANGWTEEDKALFLKQNIDACDKGNETFCTCLANYLMARYSFEEIHQMSQEVQNNNASPQAIKDASGYCSK